jgi:hypothetical protein
VLLGAGGSSALRLVLPTNKPCEEQGRRLKERKTKRTAAVYVALASLALDRHWMSGSSIVLYNDSDTRREQCDINKKRNKMSVKLNNKHQMMVVKSTLLRVESKHGMPH